MIPDLLIQQAVVLADSREVKIVALTNDFDTPEAERIAVLFGRRPEGVTCPLAHFACPFGKKHVAIVRVEDRAGSNGVLTMRFLILARELYRHLGDPFAIADRFPPEWNAGGRLPFLNWPSEALPERKLEDLDAILKHGDSGLILGATQALVDGNRVVIQRASPDEALARGLWQMLPDRSRAELWPASFAFSDELGLHLAIVPTQQPDQRAPGVLGEEAVRDYPQSRYELHLQIAIESGDRAALRKLLARRTADDMIRIVLYLIGFALVAAAIFRFVL